jgi:hypothetical protein
VRPYLDKTLHKNRAGGVAQGESVEVKPQYHNNNNNNNKIEKWNCIKFKSFFTVKGITRIKRKPIELERIFVCYSLD